MEPVFALSSTTYGGDLFARQIRRNEFEQGIDCAARIKHGRIKRKAFQLEGVAGVGDVGLYLSGSAPEVVVEESERVHNVAASGIRHKFKHDQNLHVLIYVVVVCVNLVELFTNSVCLRI